MTTKPGEVATVHAEAPEEPATLTPRPHLHLNVPEAGRPTFVAGHVILDESISASLEWGEPVDGDFATSSIHVNLIRSIGPDPEADDESMTPCYIVNLEVSLGEKHGGTDTADFAVPACYGLKALSEVFLALHERTQQMGLASLGWTRDVGDESSATRQPSASLAV